MKISINWLQKYFDTELPVPEDIAEALTFHVAEIEDIERHDGSTANQSDSMLDVKILPDRAAYMLCHRGVAKELSAILDTSMKDDPLKEELPKFPTTNELQITIEDPSKCARYMGTLIRGVRVGPSPEWLKDALESVGQRSINNVVDATNYIMLNIGQPLHAFDATKLELKDDYFAIKVRGAYEGEKITALTGEEYILPKETLLITDAHRDNPIGIAGVKGGIASGISETTKDIIIESANFDGSSIRRASQALRLWTDASLRFQNNPSSELAAYGMRDVLKLIQQIAGGEVVGITDVYPGESTEQTRLKARVVVTNEVINGVLGTSLSGGDILSTFDRLGLVYTREHDSFTVSSPFERRDITIPEDLVEEVGRIIGYDRIPAKLLPPLEADPDQARFFGVERIKDFLTEHGYTEISTQTFTVNGDIFLANPFDQTRPALRTTLTENMYEALTRSTTIAPRLMGLVKELKLFELGNIFTKQGEHLSLVLGYQSLTGKVSATTLPEILEQLGTFLGVVPPHTLSKEQNVAEINLEKIDLEKLGRDTKSAFTPKKIILGSFTTPSVYPFALRDVAVWTPEGTEEDVVLTSILKEAGELLVRIDLFDRFEKKDSNGEDSETRISYAFRLVFESSEHTLSDEDLNPIMERLTTALNAKKGWEVR